MLLTLSSVALLSLLKNFNWWWKASGDFCKSYNFLELLLEILTTVLFKDETDAIGLKDDKDDDDDDDNDNLLKFLVKVEETICKVLEAIERCTF